MSSYEDAIDQYILHLVELAMYSNLLTDEIIDMAYTRLNELADIIANSGNIRTKRRYKELLDQLKEGENVTQENLADKLSSVIDQVTVLALPWIQDLVKPIYKGKIKAPSTLKDKLLLSTYDGKNSIGDYPVTLSDRLQSIAQGAAKSQFIFATPSDIASNYVRENEATISRSIKSDIPTIVDSTVRSTERLIYDNIESVKKLIWVSTLDGRTCLVCGNRHNSQYEKGQEPMCPAHHRCRCFLVPSKENPNLPSYSEWLSRQTEETQRKILGKSRYELYKGGMKLDRFVSDGRKLRLDELI